MHTTAAAIAAHTQPRCSTIATTEGVIIAQCGRTDAAPVRTIPIRKGPAGPLRRTASRELGPELQSLVDEGRISLRRARMLQGIREVTE